MTAGAEREVVIDALGGAGDGVAGTGRGAERVFVPGALPGERWRVRLERRVPEGWQAAALACLGAAAPRAEPPCPHFGQCGGCRLQHLPADLYAAHRRERIVAALRRRGLGDAPVGEVRTAPLASRRRLRLALAPAAAGRLSLGFRQRGSRRIEPVAACPIARPELAAVLAPLAAELAVALERPWPAEASLTSTETGLDLLLHADRAARPVERVRLAAAADRLDLARVSWDRGSPEPVVTRRPPVVMVGGVPVEPPPGAFLQATEFGAGELAAAVVEWGRGARRAVDLYAGLGTLSLALIAAGTRVVRAVEGDAASAAALRRAAAGAGLGGLTVEARDLARRPLAPAELDRHDLVVLDPPRAGAGDQVRQLAAARAVVPVVAYASCSPESFARDARVLVDGGYELAEVRPIDQFRYAAEVELVARFARNAAPKRP